METFGPVKTESFRLASRTSVYPLGRSSSAQKHGDFKQLCPLRLHGFMATFLDRLYNVTLHLGSIRWKPYKHMIGCTDPNARNWLFFMHDAVSHAEFTKMIITLWVIWAARRKAIHESIFQSPEQIHRFVESYIAERCLWCNCPRDSGVEELL